MSKLILKSDFIELFKSLGIGNGSLICLQANLSKWNSVIGGYQCLLDALFEVIGKEAFRGVPLKNINLPLSIRQIGSYAFYNNTAVESLVLGDKLESIDYYAFYGIRNIQEIVLPASLTRLGPGAFAENSDLKEIWIPLGLVDMGDNVFFNCPNLIISIEAEEIPKNWDSNWNSSNLHVITGVIIG